MSFLKLNGIYKSKNINSLLLVNGIKQAPQLQQIRNIYTKGLKQSSNILNIWSKSQRIRGIIGNKEIELGKVYSDAGLNGKRLPKLEKDDEENSRKLLDSFKSPYEQQLNLSEPKNIEIMNAYYELVKDDYPKKIGTFLFLGFTNPDGINVKDVVSSYLGLDLFKDIKKIDRFIIINCKRNNDGLTFFEQYNLDGSRNFKKFYDINQITSKLKKFNDTPSPYHTFDLYFESPTIDNITIVIPPTFEFLDRTNRNDRIRRRLYKLISDSEDQIFYVPVVSGSKAYKDSINELKICELFDPFSVSTIGIITDINESSTTRHLLTPEKWLEFTDKNNLQKSSIDLRNRIYKMFFRKNESNLKKLITNKFKESKSMINSFNSLLSVHSKDSEAFLFKFASEWDLYSITLQIYLSKKIENQIFERIKESMKKIKFYESKEKEILSVSKEPNVTEIYKSLENIAIRNKDGDDAQQSKKEMIELEEFLNLKNQWLFLSERLRGQELPDYYKNSYIDEFKSSLLNISEVEGLSYDSIPNYFKISWNRSYKLILSSLLNDDAFSNQLPNKLINDSIECLTLVSKQSTINTSSHEFALFTVKYLAPIFKNSIDCDSFKVLISKEFSPSITYEQFRESVFEVIQIDTFVKTKEIFAFSYLWNYIYFKALAKKLSQDIVKLSMGSILNPLLCSSYEFIVNKQTASDLEERIFELSKNADIIKDGLGFVPLKKNNKD